MINIYIFNKNAHVDLIFDQVNLPHHCHVINSSGTYLLPVLILQIYDITITK